MKRILARLNQNKALKVRLEGPIDLKKQQNLFRVLSDARRNFQGVLLIINSYGGSLSVAQNIAASVEALKKEKIQVYCFAEEYCLNSANLILTSGSLCFANKLSVIGDVGFAERQYAIRHNIGWQSVSSNTVPLDCLLNTYQLNRQQDVQMLVHEKASQLRKAIVANRSGKLDAQQKLLQGGTITPRAAVEAGLIDGLSSCESFIRVHLDGWRISEGGEEHRYRAMNFIRSGLEVFKQE